MAKKTKKARTFKVTWPFTTRGGKRVNPDELGVFTTTDDSLAKACERAMGVVEIDDQEVTRLKRAAETGKRGGPGTVEVDRSATEGPQAQADPPAGSEGEGEDDLVTPDHIEHMTRAELRELLTGWDVSWAQRSTAAQLREQALGALAADDQSEPGDHGPDDFAGAGLEGEGAPAPAPAGDAPPFETDDAAGEGPESDPADVADAEAVPADAASGEAESAAGVQ